MNQANLQVVDWRTWGGAILVTDHLSSHRMGEDCDVSVLCTQQRRHQNTTTSQKGSRVVECSGSVVLARDVVVLVVHEPVASRVHAVVVGAASVGDNSPACNMLSFGTSSVTKSSALLMMLLRRHDEADPSKRNEEKKGNGAMPIKAPLVSLRSTRVCNG